MFDRPSQMIVSRAREFYIARFIMFTIYKISKFAASSRANFEEIVKKFFYYITVSLCGICIVKKSVEKL